MQPLQYWLLCAAALRALNVVLGYAHPRAFRERVYTRRPDDVTGLAARLFSVWTLLTCVCCVYGALHIHERGVFELTYWSFVIALAFFAAEYAVYRTVTLRFLALIACVTLSSLFFMSRHWHRHFAPKPADAAAVVVSTADWGLSNPYSASIDTPSSAASICLSRALSSGRNFSLNC